MYAQRTPSTDYCPEVLYLIIYCINTKYNTNAACGTLRLARGAEPSQRVACARKAKERNAKCELSVNEASKAKGLLASVWTISSTRCEIVCGA